MSRSPGRSSSRSPGRSPARRLDDTDEAQLERLYKPVFVMKPSSIKCSEGQTARFDLKVVGRPMPETYWFHNGKKNKTNPKECTFYLMCWPVVKLFTHVLRTTSGQRLHPQDSD